MDSEKDTRCTKCNSSQTRIRISSNERVCNHCGYIMPIVKVSDQINYSEENYAS